MALLCNRVIGYGCAPVIELDRLKSDAGPCGRAIRGQLRSDLQHRLTGRRAIRGQLRFDPQRRLPAMEASDSSRRREA